MKHSDLGVALPPFFKHKSAKQRIILYLLATDFTPEAICKMTVAELKGIRVPGYLMFDYERHLDSIDLKNGDQAFQFSSREITIHDVYALLKSTTEKVAGKALSLSAYREYLRA